MNPSKIYTAEDAHTKTVKSMSNEERLRSFLLALDAVSHTYGFGIGSGIDSDGIGIYPIVFELEPDDSERKYAVDEESRLGFR